MRKILLTFTIGAILALLYVSLGTVKAAENCSTRGRCSSETYPYCKSGVSINDCESLNTCWDGHVTDSLIGDCTYKNDPDAPPPVFDSYPSPSPSTYNCTNRDQSKCPASTYPYCYNSTSEAGVGALTDCDCVDFGTNNTTYLCLFEEKTQATDGIRCEGTQKINTAIGCIPYENPTDLVAFFLRWAVGVGGGIAFLLIVYAGFMIMTSTGNPERLKAGQELLTSAIAGIIMLIFSVFILRIIGVNILGIF